MCYKDSKENERNENGVSMMFKSGDLVKVVTESHSCYGYMGVFISEFTVPNTKLEKPLYKVMIRDEVRLMLLSELVKVS